MRPYSERLQITATAQSPHDLVNYNDRLMRRDISPDEVRSYLGSHPFSWDGVEGPFTDSLVSVASPFVVGAENLRETRGHQVVPMVGILGAVEVKELDYKLPLHGRWKSFVVAAALEPATSETDKGVLVKKSSLVILSFPSGQFFRRARFNRINTVSQS